MDKTVRPVKRIGEECTTYQIPVGTVNLEGELCLPKNTKGLVVFAHGSGSSRFSPRNTYVAKMMREVSLATLLFDLLTKDEEAIDRRTGLLRFNIRFLADRLIEVTDWLKQNESARSYNIGYFGASTGAAAALVAAAERPHVIGAVVSRGGRTDLADSVLSKVKAPTLFIAGSLDLPIIEINRESLLKLNTEKRLDIVPGASHLFEEERALDDVARLAREWFLTHLSQKPAKRHKSSEHY